MSADDRTTERAEKTLAGCALWPSVLISLLAGSLWLAKVWVGVEEIVEENKEQVQANLNGLSIACHRDALIVSNPFRRDIWFSLNGIEPMTHYQMMLHRLTSKKSVIDAPLNPEVFGPPTVGSWWTEPPIMLAPGAAHSIPLSVPRACADPVPPHEILPEQRELPNADQIQARLIRCEFVTFKYEASYDSRSANVSIDRVCGLTSRPKGI